MSTNTDADPHRQAGSFSKRKLKIVTRLAVIVVVVAIAAFRPQLESWLNKSGFPDPTAESNSNSGLHLPGGTAESDASPAEPDALGVLSEIRPGVFRSTAGLLYVPNGRDKHRIDHVLLHQKDDTSKPVHGVFDGNRSTILACIDEAYALTGSVNNRVQQTHEGSRTVYSVDLGRRIGYLGGQVGQRKNHPECRFLQLVLQNENEVVTAYPTNRR